MYKWADVSHKTLIRLADGATIPANIDNSDYKDALTWVQVNGPIPEPDPPSQAQIDEIARLLAIEDTIKNDATLASLKAMTNAQFDTWWAANVTSNAQANAVLKRIARVLLRRVL